jgi:hypothetical protein
MLNLLFLTLLINSLQGSVQEFPDPVVEDAFNFTGYIVDIGMGYMKTYGIAEIFQS